MQPVALFFNTAIEGGSFFEEAGNALMAPVRVLFSGKTYSLEGTNFRELPKEESAIVRIIKVAVSILLLIPMVIAGSVVKGIALLKASVRERSDMLSHFLNTPTPPKPRYEEPFFKTDENYQNTIKALSCHDRTVDDELTSPESAEVILNKLPTIVLHQIEKASSKFSRVRAQEIMNGFRNRYSNILPYDYNIPTSVDYINASRVIFEDMDFIATQAPFVNLYSGRTDTLSHFIDMTISAGSKTIVTLLNKAEKGKADPYWEGKQSLSGERWLVCESQDPLVETPRGERLVKRTLVIQDKEFKELQKLTQFHYEHWPDHGPPSEELFNHFLEEIEEHGESGPLVTHCSAGVGRTGTFIAALGLRKKMRDLLAKNKEAKPTVNMAQVILELRLQRNEMIQSASQITAVETALKTFYKELTA